MTAKLVYDPDVDGRNHADFHRKCDEFKNIFVTMETNYNGHICGGFATSVKASRQLIKDKNQFVCVIRSSLPDKKPTLYKIKKQYIEENLAVFYARNGRNPGMIMLWDTTLRIIDLETAKVPAGPHGLGGGCHAATFESYGRGHFTPIYTAEEICGGDPLTIDHCDGMYFYIEKMNVWSIMVESE